MVSERQVSSLQHGEAGFTLPWAAWVQRGVMFVNGEYPLRETSNGNCTLRLLKQADGRMLVDVSTLDDGNICTIPPFGPDAQRVRIDERLMPPPPSIHRRIYDMERGESAFIRVEDVWVYEGRRMWINGYTPISSEMTPETPVRLFYDRNTGINVDLTYCNGHVYDSSPPLQGPMFPIQVHRRIA